MSSPKAQSVTTNKPSQGRGRPRSQQAQQNILKAAYELLLEVGFTELTIEGVAARAGVSKPTIYLRWSSKARLATDAFLAATASDLAFPDTGSAQEDIRQQMRQLAQLMNSPRGQMIATIIGGGQSDPELMQAFRENWLMVRRVEGRQVFQRGIDRGEFPANLDIEMAIDALYSPLFYRLLVKHAPLTLELVDELIALIMPGLQA